MTDNAGVDEGNLVQWSLTLDGGGDVRTTTDTDGRYAFVVPADSQQNIRQVLEGDRIGTGDGAGLDLIAPSGEVVTIDLGSTDGVVPPTVLTSLFDVDMAAVQFTFDRNASAGMSTDDLLVENLTTNDVIDAGEFVMTYDASSDTVTFAATTLLVDGNYRFTLQTDAMAAPAVVTDYVLAGDANRDRTVSILDFAILRSNFGSAGTFSQGDFNYDGTVSILDFALLRGSFGSTLAAPSASLFATDDD